MGDSHDLRADTSARQRAGAGDVLTEIERTVIELVARSPETLTRSGNGVAMSWTGRTGMVTAEINADRESRLQLQIVVDGGFFAMSMVDASNRSPVLLEAVALIRENLR